jgi:hypothetical protein
VHISLGNRRRGQGREQQSLWPLFLSLLDVDGRPPKRTQPIFNDLRVGRCEPIEGGGII